MSQFHPLTVRGIHRETRDSVVLTLEPEAGDREAFRFIQGQYLTFRKELHGEELRRSYSICTGRDEGILKVGIKKVADGWFSTWANEELAVGDVLEAMPPAGSFHLPLEPGKARHILCVAGGSGITPVLSIIRTTLAAEPRSRVTLLYGNQSSNSIMFREALEDLKNSHMRRFTLVHVLERESQDIDLFNGILDKQKCLALFSHWVDVDTLDAAFICGPRPMMLAVAEALREKGLDEARIKYELFASAPRGQGGPAAARAEIAAETDACEMTLTLAGTQRRLSMAKSGQSILEAALGEGIDVPYACKAGVCSTCRAKVLEGEVEMDANFALEDYEVRAGYVLTCQSYPLTDRLSVDYDQ